MSARRQQGVALLVALLVVALATVLIAALLDSGQLALARTRNLLRGEQAQAYGRGLEAYAAQVLVDDAANGQLDTNDDIWAVPLPPTDVTGGTISATMRDMNGCFNLNNLVDADGQRQKVWMDRFGRLLENLQLSPAIAEVAADWIDRDQDASQGGAEDPVYLGRQPAYRSAGHGFADVSELRLLDGVDAHAYALLAPWVCALPTQTALNINTAGIPLLRSLAPDITEAVAAQLHAKGHAHWNSVHAAMSVLQRAGVRVDPADKAGLGVSSEYFVARARITLDGIDYDYRSLIQRRSGIRVLARQRGL
ncbi:MAG TPA: type II secretion system minor pseudopilin GspK [Rhodanobacteraceae bacterium]|nr:type II secretion system minor pseudopilin GspK [Rhodanobacteraceae bacterium]